MAGADDRVLLDEQIAYYRARAAEYDATAPIDGDPFAEDTGRIRNALRAFDPRGRVIELAAGTGQWTGILADHADELVVTDASPEMLELNRAKVGERDLEYRVVDAFALSATHDFDVVFFGFFLSHVPAVQFDAFWTGVDGLLAPGGRVFFVDEADHGLWDEDWLDADGGIVRRTLLDGTQHRAVKVLWQPPSLAARLRRIGWAIDVSASGPFLWGSGSRA
jgi:SAM-dependent methyltransferase